MDPNIDLVLNSTKYAGFVLFLLGYIALQFGLVKGSSYVYSGVNVVAALLISVGLVVENDVGELAFHAAWITISVLGMLRLQVLSRLTRFTAEESAFLRAKLPELDRRLARVLLDHGEWEDAHPGEALSREGAPVEHLAFLSQGRACVTVDGAEVATLERGSYVGELTVLESEPAIATVTISEPSRCLRIEASALRTLAAANPDIRGAIQSSFAREMRLKIAISNARAKREMAEPA